jgi:hypothetical protein
VSVTQHVLLSYQLARHPCSSNFTTRFGSVLLTCAHSVIFSGSRRTSVTCVFW